MMHSRNKCKILKLIGQILFVVITGTIIGLSGFTQYGIMIGTGIGCFFGFIPYTIGAIDEIQQTKKSHILQPSRKGDMT